MDIEIDLSRAPFHCAYLERQLLAEELVANTTPMLDYLFFVQNLDLPAQKGS
jgi:hypothetical protein